MTIHALSRNETKRIIALIAAVACCLFVSGCGKIQIFEKNEKTYTKIAYSKDQLADDTYYIKDGASFFEPMKPQGGDGLFYGQDDLVMIPDLYKGEHIAYKSASTSVLKDVSLKRYRNDGLSFGIYGFVLSDDGYLTTSVGNAIKGSDMATALSGKEGDQIKIVTIDGKAAKDITVTKQGVIEGFSDPDKESKFCFYIGTVYYEANIKPDYTFLETFESYTLSSSELSKIGYLMLELPADAKSGYYVINGGLFRYHDKPKSEVATATGENFNEPYYSDEVNAIAKDSKKYNINFNTALDNVGIEIDYSVDSLNNSDAESGSLSDDMSCIIVSPSGKQYDVPCADGVGKLELSYAEAGRWTAVIHPSYVTVTDIHAYNIEQVETSAESRKKATLPKDGSYRFAISYKGTGDVWGTIENTETNKSISFTNKDSKDSGIINADWLDAEAGPYIIRIYHYNSQTVIGDCNITNIGTDDKEFIFK